MLSDCCLAGLGRPSEDPSGLGDPFAGHSLGATETPQESFAFSGQLQLDDAGPPIWAFPASEESSTMKRKLSHNAYERGRRKKLNVLYASLRSLLPETEHHRKMSIPSTVSRVLQYIPELQRHVERLRRRKEEIMGKLSREGDRVDPRPPGDGGRSVCPVISIAHLGEREMAIQIICSSCGGARRPMSGVLGYLEREGLGVISASFLAMDETRALYSLHLQHSCGPIVRGGREKKNGTGRLNSPSNSTPSMKRKKCPQMWSPGR